MKIFALSRLDNVCWDEYIGFVVCAEDEIDARKLAIERDSCSRSLWLDHARASCIEITQDCERGIILESFNAG